jgi:hypothetical protein
MGDAGRSPRRRLLWILVVGLLCVGLIVFSAIKIRFAVEGKRISEFEVTRLSLTHSITRGPDGSFRGPAAEKPAGGGKPDAAGGKAKPCPT